MPPEPLKSKLITPKPSKNLVIRNRLIHKLNNGLNYPIIIISAPAGYGKTTILSEWVNQIKYSSAWLSLDENDNDIKRFWYYFTISLNSLGFNFDEKQIYEPKSTQVIPFDAYLAHVINRLSQEKHHRILILEDFNYISNDKIYQTLTYFLSHLILSQNENFHIVFSSRTDLNLSIAKFRAQNKIHEIRTQDLRFTIDETKQLFEKQFHQTFSLDSIQGIDQFFEGWVTGIKLMALSFPLENHVNELIKLLPVSKSYTWDFLIDEVLNKQTADIQKFLLQTSVLEIFSADLCNFLTDRIDSQSILDQLFQSNLFISPLDNERRWFRYHPVFRNLLTDRNEKISREEFTNLHIKAYHWYSNNTSLHDSQYFALEHVLKAKNFTKAEEILLEISLSMISRGDSYRLSNYLDQIPPSIIRGNLWLSLYKAWTLFISGNFDQSEKLMAEIENIDNLENVQMPADMKKLSGYIAAIRSQIVREQGDYIKSLHLSYQAYYGLLEEKSILKSTISMNMGNCYLKMGNLSKAEEFFLESNQLATEIGCYSVALSTIKRLGDIKYFEGLYFEAENIYKKGILLGEKWGQNDKPLYYTAMIYPRLGLIEYERNNLDRAFDYFQKGKYLGEDSNIPTLKLASYLGNALVFMANNELKLAEDEINRAFNLLDYSLDTFDVSLHQMVQFLYYRKINNSLLIQTWINQQKIDIKETPTLDQELIYTSLFRAYIYLGKHTIIQESLDKLFRIAQLNNRTHLIVDTLILKSILSFNEGNYSSASNTFTEAIRLAKSGGFQRIFIDEALSISGLVRKMIETEPDLYQPDIFQKILTTDDDGVSKSNIIFEELSDREVEILNLVASGKKNMDIADSLFITIGTVKWHLTNIYGKLNTTNRVQAINTARKLKII